MENKLEKLLNKAAELERQGTQQSELAQIYLDIAACYRKQKDKAKKTEYLEKSKNLKETISNTDKQISQLLDDELDLIIEIDDLKEKFETLEKFVKKHPNFSLGYFELAYISEHLQLWENAVKNYLEFIQKEKDINNLVFAYNNLAILYENDYYQQYDKAKEHYEKAIKLNPAFADAFNNFALLLTNDYFKQYEKAKEYYEKAIELKPDYAEAYNNLALLLTNDYFKQYEKAKENYEKAINLEPHYAEAYHNLALLYLENFKEEEKAKYYFAKAIEINKDFSYSRLEILKLIQKFPYITKIEVNKLRHLKNITIDISKEKLQHLLITGKNGSGKTTVLNECKNYLKKILEMPIDGLFSEKGRNEIFEPIENNFKIHFSSKHLTEIRLARETGIFVVKHFDSYRKLQAKGTQSVEKITLPHINQIDYEPNQQRLSDKMAAYLVDMDYTRLRAHIDKDETTFNEINNWFTIFLEVLQTIDNQIVGLKYSPADNLHNFLLQVKMPDNSTIQVSFEELPDGFKAAFYIVFELILQMQSKVQTTYELPGVVLIDEPELFLHIEMQKKILPALIKIFPRIQFIVATHSPFVLSSVENAVVFDMETKWRFENASQLSYSGLVEYYFKQNEYSEKIKKEITVFEKLAQQTEHTDEDLELIAELDEKFKNISPLLSPELYLQYKTARKAIEQ